jgi:hypothetical protein
MLKYKAKRHQIMNKEYLPLGISVVVLVALFIFYPMHYQPSFDMGTETIVIENVFFVGFSGEASNSLVLYVRNTGSGREVVLDQANVTCFDGAKVFIIAPEERNLSIETSGRIVLFNVDWIKDLEYKIDVFNAKGQLVGCIKVTA